MAYYVDGAATVQFAKWITELASAWDARLTEARIRLYAQALGDIPFETLQAAGARAILQSKWFPSVSEFRQYVQPTVEDAALLAWSGFCQAASAVGAYGNLDVEDAAAAEALRVVFGSWPEFCYLEDGPALTQKRQEFLAAYRHAVRMSRPPHARLVGLCGEPPPGLASATWIGRLGASGTVDVVRDRPRLGGGLDGMASLPEGPHEAAGEGGEGSVGGPHHLAGPSAGGGA